MKIIIDDACYAYEKLFSNLGEVQAIPGKEINNENIKNADVLIIRSRTKANKTLLKNSNIKFIGSCVAGLDHIDQTYLANNNIAFHSAQGCNANSVAEFVMMNLINLADELNFNLKDKTIGIIGVGNVGKKLYKKCKIFGLKTLLNDPLRAKQEGSKNFVDLKTALGADIITVHTPLTKTGDYPTLNLINKTHQELLKNKIVINTARGGVINENMWQQTQTMANIIDCWENEPEININLQNNAFIATPHIAGHSIDAKLMGSFMIYQSLCAYLQQPQKIKFTDLLGVIKPINKQQTLRETFNEIYDFKKDTTVIKDLTKFEDYRRHYPNRYEWKHYSKELNSFFEKLIRNI